MKKVLLKGRAQSGPVHSLYRTLIEVPPDGYQIFTGKFTTMRKQQPQTGLNKKRQLIYSFDKKLQSFSYLRNLWREVKTLLYIGIKKTQSPRPLFESNPDLVYASQQLIFAKLRWVVDFEFANGLVDYGDIKMGRKFVQKALASKYCKKIMPWSEWAKRTLLRSLDCTSFKEKIEVVHFGLETKNFFKKKDNDKLRLLFVGSTNLFNYLNFEWKGGFEVVEAFLELNKRYDDLELVVRSWVPPEILEKCSKNPNIKVLCSPLSDEELAHLYASSDIFIFPSYLNLGMVILEAMSYELPVVAPRIYDVPEAVKEMETGILLDCPKLPLYLWNGAPNHYDRNLLLGIRHVRPWRVKQVVEKTSLLVEDGSLRRKIGREARRLIECGEFSIKNRNEKLKRILDEATEFS
jgi:glycosyltransferase involved in cell wall biosynthesis